MAPKNLASRKRRSQLDDTRASDSAAKHQSDQGTNSDSDTGAAQAAAKLLVPPKKPKFTTPFKHPPPEPLENGSACSSPSASGFIIVPSRREREKKPSKKKTTPTSSKVFSDDDVISLLKGLAVFWANGRNNKWAEFHQFVKDDLPNQFTKTQISEKIRSLKKKFDANSDKARANGGRIDLSDPHESVVFELSKALWGDEIGIVDEKGGMGENGDVEVEAAPVVPTPTKSLKKGKREADEAIEKKVVSAKKQKVEKKKIESKNDKKVIKMNVEVYEDDSSSESEQLPKAKAPPAKNGVAHSDSDSEESSGSEEEGDVRDAANTILSIRELVHKNGEGSKKTRKKTRKQGDELDKKKEVVVEGMQVDENDEGNMISGKQKQVEGNDEGKKISGKRKQVEGNDEGNMISGKRKQVEGNDEGNKVSRKRKQVDGSGERNKKTRKTKLVDECGEASKTATEHKEVDYHEEEGEEEELLEEGKQEDEHIVKKDLAKQGKQVNEHHEEHHMPANQNQKMGPRIDNFQSAYPLLYSSFNIFGPKFVMEECAFIGRENARELEEKWRELNADMHRLELKRLDLMNRHGK